MNLNESIKTVLKQYITEQENKNKNPQPINTSACLDPGYAKNILLLIDSVFYSFNSVFNTAKKTEVANNQSINASITFPEKLSKLHTEIKSLFGKYSPDPFKKSDKCYLAVHVLEYTYEYNLTKNPNMTGLLQTKVNELINNLKTNEKYSILNPEKSLPILEDILRMLVAKA